MKHQGSKKGRKSAPSLLSTEPVGASRVELAVRIREAGHVRRIVQRHRISAGDRMMPRPVTRHAIIRQALPLVLAMNEQHKGQGADKRNAKGCAARNVQHEQQGTGREQTQTQDERDRIADREWPTWGFDSRVSHEIALRFACETRHQVYYVRRCQVLHDESPLIGRGADRRPSPTRGGGAAGPAINIARSRPNQL